ncbi:MAG: alpha/beta hydrolase [Deltaproteobacteria bacterium]|jgi:fermentation-respiration switch protein FrsA (DUF1100 family)|nr:alpha/beta hydrolase [Deltaproteobacteria bacterium]
MNQEENQENRTVETGEEAPAGQQAEQEASKNRPGLGSWLNRGFYFGRGGVTVRRLGPGRTAWRCVAAAFILAAVLTAGLAVFKNRFIFHPVRGLELNLASIGPPYEAVQLEGLNGAAVFAWHVQAPPGSPAVLLLHGNGGNLEHMIGRVLLYHQLGYEVLAPDYEGFGLSEGSPSEAATYADAQAGWDWLVRRGTPPDRILIHGFSLGGGPASWLAARQAASRNPLVLDSTFTTLSETAAWHFPVLKPALPLALGSAFDVRGRLAQLNSIMLLVLHSPQDEVVPFELGRANYEAYQGGPKAFAELRGRHMDFIPNQEVYRQVLEERLGAWAGQGRRDEPQASGAETAPVDEP